MRAKLILAKLLCELQSADIPKAINRTRTFFDISKFPHRETVNSNWYAYFFEINDEHGLGDLFIASLLSIANRQKGSDFSLTHYLVKNEVYTNSGKRIDIVLAGIGADHGKYIIIENKLFHWLHNDLKEYWAHFDSDPANKLGIVLTLKKITIPANEKDSFVNILHSELIREVQNRLFMKILTPKQQVYLTDFIESVNNLTKDTIMNDQVRFYFNNIESINQVAKTKEEAEKFIVSQIQIAADKLGCGVGGDQQYRWLILKNIKSVYYTIVYDELLSAQQSIGIIIELDRIARKQIAYLDKKLIIKIQKAGLRHKETDHKFYTHYISEYYPIDQKILTDLNQFIVGKITGTFEPLMNEVVSLLKAKGLR